MKKLILDENFDNVGVDVQAVSSPSFVQANKEHDEDKKEFEDAIKENEKLAKETIPKEGSTGKKVTSPALKKMHLSEALFDEDIDGRVVQYSVDIIEHGSLMPNESNIDDALSKAGFDVAGVAFSTSWSNWKNYEGGINESVHPENRDEFTRRLWSFLYDMMTDFDASYDDIYQEVRKFCDEGPLIDFDESLSESSTVWRDATEGEETRKKRYQDYFNYLTDGEPKEFPRATAEKPITHTWWCYLRGSFDEADRKSVQMALHVVSYCPEQGASYDEEAIRQYAEEILKKINYPVDKAKYKFTGGNGDQGDALIYIYSKYLPSNIRREISVRNSLYTNESLNESVNEEDLEIRLINYIKKFQKHYNIDAASMSKVLAAVGKSIELLNPVNESLKEDLDEGDYDDLQSDVYNALADVVFKYQWKGISQAEVEKAIEWFEIKFFEDEFEEGLKESLEGDKKSNLESEIYQSLERIATKYDKFDDFTFDDMEEAITAAFDDLANDFGLMESLEYQIAREQIKRFNEGKMPENWEPNTYLENLVKNNHITKTEATRLTESLLSESDDRFELQAWCCDGNNFARYREPMYWRKVGVYDTEEEAKSFVNKAKKVSRQHEGDGSVQIIKNGHWCVWSDIVGH